MDQAAKKKILIGVASGAAALLVLAFGWFLFYISQFAAYNDTAYHFAIKYPKKWEKTVAPQPGVAVIFVSPKERPSDKFRENVTVTIEDVPAELATLKSFSNKILEQMTAVFGNVKVAESKPIEFGGRRGHQALFVAGKPDNMSILTVWTMKGAKAYIFMYIAVGNQYEAHRPYVMDMIKSFYLK
jgi:eukaryotic-like serine/threonine-protein kinase